ncbi:MAG: hypothetical protein LBS60_00070 [Deltaproteobacteria bacterium]|jgi:hypothetical protein|nr:hypothetical protein [Deltaproteobacteria bacterium]
MAQRPKLLVLPLAVALLATAYGGLALAQNGQPGLEVRLESLKAAMEKDLERAKDQKNVSALALKYAANAWALAAEAQAQVTAPFSAAAKLKELNQRWANQGATWSSRETLGLQLYFDSLVALALGLAAEDKSGDWVYQELSSLIKATRSPRTPLPPANHDPDSRVVWSNRLVAVAPIVVRLKCPDKSEALLALQANLVQRAKAIAERRDVHYQGRMELLFLNNAKTITDLNFLLAQSPLSPFATEAWTLEAEWAKERQTATNSLADQISLSWLTTAQLSIPLAFWLAGQP